MCHNAEAVATVYDTLFRELSPQRRTQLLRYLDRAQAYYVDRVRQRDWWYWNNPSNTIAVGNGCGGIVALALLHSTPGSAEAIDLAVQTIHERYQGIAEDGSCVEGNLYWDYGFTYQLLFGCALENATGDDRRLLSDVRYENTPYFVKTQLGGAGTLLVFNDTQPWLTGAGVASVFGARLDDDLLRWLADETIAAAAAETTPVFTRPQFYALAFRRRDAKASPDSPPGLPTVAHLPKLNWGVLRSDPRAWKSGLVVGVKGRDGATTHHAQEDLGGFTLDGGGEALVIDPGYYQGEATKHSVPIIDGSGPDRRGRALIVDAEERGPWRMMTVDASNAYEKVATRMRRVFVLHGEEALIVLDDIIPKGPGRVTHQLQCGAYAATGDDGQPATVRGDLGWLSIRTGGPTLKWSVDGPLDFGRSWINAQEDASWYRLDGVYTARAGQPLVTIFLPHAPATTAPRAECQHAGKEIRVVLPGGAVAAFATGERGWRWVQP
jgi:hypothetical protein